MYEPAPPLPIPGEAVQEVRSAEQVALHFPIAGPGTRILAYAADAVALVTIQIIVLVGLLLTTPLAKTFSEILQPIIDQARGGQRADQQMVTAGMFIIAVMLIIQLVVEWGYFVVSERVSNGRSIGKRLVGLRVIGQDGLPLTLRGSLVRNLLRAVDVLPGSYVVGLVAIVVSPKGQRLGDLAAGSIVVRLDAGAPLEMPLEETAVSAAFRFSRAQITALGPLERQLLRQTLRRLEVMNDDLSAAALERTVEALRGRMGYEPVAPAQRLEFLRALLQAIERN